MKASWRWREYCPEIVSFMVQLTEKGGRRCVKCWKKRDGRIYMQFKNQHEEKDAALEENR